MVYKWDDLQTNQLEVEWGEQNLQPRGTRRARNAQGLYRRATTTTRDNNNNNNKLLSATLVVVSTLAAIGMATIVALVLIRTPISSKRMENNNGDGKGGPSKAEDMGSLPVLEVNSTFFPSVEPTGVPTTRPTFHPTTWGWPTVPPTVLQSDMPSQMHSSLPSTSPSTNTPSENPSMLPSPTILKAPPAPEPIEPIPCIDETGIYPNHAGTLVTCEWFTTVGTYNYNKNCEKTPLGKACLFSCRNYNTCTLVTERPSHSPTVSPTTSFPTDSPTAGPPKSITLQATGDASVKEATPTANFGAASWLKIDTKPLPLPQDMGSSSSSSNTANGAFHAMLRFDLTKEEANRPISSAILRIKSANSCSSGGILQRTHSPHWDENSVTWESAPQGDGTELGRLGMIKSGFWYSVNVTGALKEGHETLSLRLYPGGSDECLFVSKDNVNGGGPELHIVFDDV